MALETTVNATRKYADAASRAKPNYEPHRHIVSPYTCGILFLFGGSIIGKNKMGSNVTLAKVPGRVRTRKVDSLNPKNQDFGVLPYQFEANDTEAAPADGTAFDQGFISAKGIKKHDILKSIATGNTYYVNSVSSNTVNMTIHVGGTEAVTSGDKFIKTGSAHPDFFTYGTGVSMEPEEYSNLIQTFCNEVGLGLLAKQQAVFPMGNGNPEDRMVVLEHHAFSRELAGIDGVKGTDTHNSETVQTADGLRSLAETVIDCGGSLTYETFRKDLEIRVAKPGPSMHMTGSLVKSIMSLWLEAKVQTSMDEKAYGTDIEKIRGLYMHELRCSEVMENYPGETLIFKPENLERCVLGELDSIFMENVHAQNTAGEVDAYVTSECLLRTDEEAVTRLTGIFA